MIKLLIFITLFIGIGAVAGAAMMWIDPTGLMWGGDTLLVMLRYKMPWPDLFFRDFVPSAIALFIINGMSQLTAAILLFKKRQLASWAVLTCGIILMLWIILEWWIFGSNALCNFYFILGLLETSISFQRIRTENGGIA